MISITISGCIQSTDNASTDNKISGGFSQNHARNPSDVPFDATRRQWAGNAGNMSEEERQKLLEERQKKAIDAWNGKNQDDGCQMETPRGNSKGICKAMDEKLACTMDNPVRQRRNDIP